MDISIINQFKFRSLHPNIRLGTASDRYAGWIDQIYSKEIYEGRISRRMNKVGGKSFVEETLPLESVSEYFEHFSVLEIDFTFYAALVDKDKNFHVLRSYAQHLSENDRVILKVPQIIFAQKMRRGKDYIENETYLNANAFTNEPAAAMPGNRLSGMIFEQEYQRKKDRASVD